MKRAATILGILAFWMTAQAQNPAQPPPTRPNLDYMKFSRATSGNANGITGTPVLGGAVGATTPWPDGVPVLENTQGITVSNKSTILPHANSFAAGTPIYYRDSTTTTPFGRGFLPQGAELLDGLNATAVAAQVGWPIPVFIKGGLDVDGSATTSTYALYTDGTNWHTGSFGTIKGIRDLSSGFTAIFGTAGLTTDRAVNIPDATSTTVIGETASGTGFVYNIRTDGGQDKRVISLADVNTALSLSDPNINAIQMWDDTDNAWTWVTIGSNLTYTHATHTLSSAAGGSGTPGGANTQVQYNNSTAFGGAAGFTFDGTSKITLGVASTSVGTIDFKNASTGTITVRPVTGALATTILQLPAKGTTDTLACLSDIVAGTGTVTHTAGALTSNAIVLGNAAADTKVSTALNTDGAGKLILGLASTTLGSIDFKNASGAGTITLQSVAGASGATTLTLPATTGTLATLADIVAGTGTVTNPANLTTSSLVIGGANGTTDVKTMGGLATDGVSKIMLGVSGTSNGKIEMRNTTGGGGSIILQPPTGALGSQVLTLPASTGTLATTDQGGFVSQASGLAPAFIGVGVPVTAWKTNIDLKANASTAIFTVPAGHSFVCTNSTVVVDTVTGAPAGNFAFAYKIDLPSGNAMTMATPGGAVVPQVNRYYAQIPSAVGGPFVVAVAASSVQITITAGFGSETPTPPTTCTGTVYVNGFYY